jgi:UDP-sugar pyrophosphorylase
MESTADLTKRLTDLGQDHIVEKLAGATSEQLHALEEQLNHLDKTYPGGLKAYAERGRKLLSDSRDGINPYEDYKPEIPKSVSLDFTNEERITHY